MVTVPVREKVWPFPPMVSVTDWPFVTLDRFGVIQLRSSVTGQLHSLEPDTDTLRVVPEDPTSISDGVTTSDEAHESLRRRCWVRVNVAPAPDIVSVAVRGDDPVCSATV